MAPELASEDKALVDRIRRKQEEAEKFHAPHRNRWDHLFSLYNSYQEFRDAHKAAAPRDRDDILSDGRQVFGAELFIPYSFSVVETILPRLLANRPRMGVRPRGRASEKNVENVRYLIDSQQENIDFELKLQDTAKSGLIYGLGIQKTLWREEYRKRIKKVPATLPNQQMQYTEQVVEEVCFDDPDVLSVDIFDFFWDHLAANIKDCSWVLHRTWRNDEYVMRKLQSGEWEPPVEITAEDISGLSSGKYDETVAQRQRSTGLDLTRSSDGAPHEVWEYHNPYGNDGLGEVVTILDRTYPVQQGPSPYHHGELPFQAFRPSTRGMPTLPGIGEIEPIEHLQMEINALRSQRRDNAALAIQKVFAYAEGLVDPNDLSMFPGAAFATAGDPRELLFPIPTQGLDQSGYQEEGALKADIEQTTGISDSVMGTGDAGQTATGVQLTQTAANVRIANKTKRVSAELVRPATQQFYELDKQKIESRMFAMPATPTARDPNRRWTWVELTPAELEGEFDFIPEDDSTAPINVPQDRADAQALTLLRGDPNLDQRALATEILRKMGYKNPEAYLAPDQRVPPSMLDILVQMGVDKNVLTQAYDQAIQLEQQQSQASPNAPQGGPSDQGPPPGQEQKGRPGGQGQ